eukprot:7184097-Alexandrium_andersonii.AAC.1
MTPQSSTADRSFATSESTQNSASSKTSLGCANSVTIWGPSNTRNERGSMRPFAPMLWASQSYT